LEVTVGSYWLIVICYSFEKVNKESFKSSEDLQCGNAAGNVIVDNLRLARSGNGSEVAKADTNGVISGGFRGTC